MRRKGRVAVFLSGRGSNFEALYHATLKKANYEIVAVVSDQREARGLERGKEFGISTFFVSPKRKSKELYEKLIVGILEENDVDLVCLAGYMRIVGETLLEAYAGRIMNIHPSLLPAFRGLDAQQQALDYGAKVSGCTVHFVDPGVDTGPIIIQRTVKVKDDDSTETLSQRILKQEHKVYSKAVSLFFKKKLKIEGRKVIIL
ncbi:MAG: phosphoribosylglycinamide formyltransferase [bacterium]|nr:phosphoribosylglycinamide formyltransferase [bacterium]